MTIKSQRVLFASLSKSRNVCRFAALTEEEQKEVVEKVKAKLKEKFPDAVGEDGSVQLSDGETDTTEEAPADATEEQGNTEEAPAATQEDTTSEGDSEEQPEEAPAPVEEKSKGGIESVLNPDDLDWGDDDSNEETTTEEDSATDDSEEDDSADGDEGDDSEVEDDSEDDSEEKPKEESKEAGGEITAEEEEDDDSEDSEVEEIADEIEEDVEKIKGKDGVDSSNVLKLFSDMMEMVNLLVKVRVPRNRSSKPKVAAERIATSIVHGAIAENIARSMVSKRGLQLNRKDSDLIHDTGGTSKGANKDTDLRPPRDDVRKRFRTKDKPADQRDPDTDNDKDKRSD